MIRINQQVHTLEDLVAEERWLIRAVSDLIQSPLPRATRKRTLERRRAQVAAWEVRIQEVRSAILVVSNPNL